jgi:hypothetical protein
VTLGLRTRDDDAVAVLKQLPNHVIDLLIEHCGTLTTAQLAAAGFDRYRIRRWVQRGLLIAVADGMFAAAALRSLLDDWTWFALRSRAFLLASSPDACAGSWSAVALHDLPVIGPPPHLPCIIRTGRPPRGSEHTGNGWTRFATVPEELLDIVSGLSVLSPAGCVVDVGRRTAHLPALVVADAVALREGSTRSMAMDLDRLRNWPRTRRSRWAVIHADPDCESPLETIGRFAIIKGGLTVPRSNVWLGIDVPRYRIDHYWDDIRHGVEGDGIGKYELRRPRDPREALVYEKDRENEIRSWGVTLDRYLWSRTLRDPRSLSDRCEQAMRRPPLPAMPELRTWNSDEGFRLLGVTPPRLRPRSAGWETRVVEALEKLRR